MSAGEKEVKKREKNRERITQMLHHISLFSHSVLRQTEKAYATHSYRAYSVYNKQVPILPKRSHPHLRERRQGCRRHLNRAFHCGSSLEKRQQQTRSGSGSTCDTSDRGTGDIKSRNVSSTLTVRKKKETKLIKSFTDSIHFVHPFQCVSTLLFPASRLLTFSCLLLPHPLAPHPCLPPRLFPVLLFPLPHLAFAFLFSFLSENSHPFMQSFHFSTPHPFLLSGARSTESNRGEKTKAGTCVRESPDHNRKRGMGGERGIMRLQ